MAEADKKALRKPSLPPRPLYRYPSGEPATAQPKGKVAQAKAKKPKRGKR